MGVSKTDPVTDAQIQGIGSPGGPGKKHITDPR